MKIYECCPFNNENLVSLIKIKENEKWIDELHVIESNKNFRYDDKKYNFIYQNEKIVRYHKIDGKKYFKTNNLIERLFKRNITSKAWKNEAIQRNLTIKFLPNLQDDDIVIISDIDEIIDSKYKEEIIKETLKRGIITIKIHFTLFYLNLFSENWGGAPDYSYRIFIMTGKYLKNMKITLDKLRKKGERGELIDKVYCLDGFKGFHHSWLGNSDFIINKLKSYCHDENDHLAEIYDKQNKTYKIEEIKKLIKEQKSIFPNHKLKVNNLVDSLSYIKNNKDIFKEYFL